MESKDGIEKEERKTGIRKKKRAPLTYRIEEEYDGRKVEIME